MSTTSLMETYTNLESRLTTSENCGGGRWRGGSADLTIEDIKTINLYLRIDEYYYDSFPSWEKKINSFKSFRGLLSSYGILSDFGLNKGNSLIKLNF
jgi:hypothetical protein